MGVKMTLYELGWTANGFPETRQRYWNGYILFYDRIDDSLKTPRTPRKSGGGTSVGGGNGAGARCSSFLFLFRSSSFKIDSFFQEGIHVLTDFV